MKNNISFIKEQINKREWTPDCQGKQNLDMPILTISTRYWSDFTAKPSFILGDAEDDYAILLSPDYYIKGNNEEDCKLKVKQWYKEYLQEAINKILDN